MILEIWWRIVLHEFNKIPKIVLFNFVLLFVVLFVLFYNDVKNAFHYLTPASRPISGREQSTAVSIQTSFRKIYQIARKFTVSIRTKNTDSIFNPYHTILDRDDTVASLGSGFIIDERGYIVTNYHVIQNAENIEVIHSNGKIYPAKYIGSHENADIALLKIDIDKLETIAKLGNSDEVEVGDWAIAVGSPFGLEKTFTVGVVSAKAREDIDDSGQTHIQIDTAINPGSSGGPLLNIYGEVVGINRMIRSTSGQSAGIGFAIPSNYVKKVLRLIEEHVGENIRAATLGVVASVPLEEHKKELGIDSKKHGVLVYDVEAGSSAFLAGIKKYDFFLKVNDIPIESLKELREQIALVGNGGLLKFQILREGREMLIYVKLVNKNPN